MIKVLFICFYVNFSQLSPYLFLDWELFLIFHFPCSKRPRQNRWFFERAEQWQVETKDTHWKGLWRVILRGDTMPRMMRKGDPKTAAVLLAKRSTRIAWHRSKDSRSDFFLSFLHLAAPHALWDLSSQNRNQTQSPGIESTESEPLDCQGIPLERLLEEDKFG